MSEQIDIRRDDAVERRKETIRALRERDGDTCQHPDCGQKIDFSIPEGPLFATIDHWFSQSYGRQNGWTHEEIWHITNLRIMHRKCNAKKGDLIPNEDGTLPQKPKPTFRYRRQKRAQRAEICTACNAGRDLGPDEVCASCNSGPQPERWPRWAKVKSADCDHEIFWCWACGSGVVDRTPAIDIAVRQGESGEWDYE